MARRDVRREDQDVGMIAHPEGVVVLLCHRVPSVAITVSPDDPIDPIDPASFDLRISRRVQARCSATSQNSFPAHVMSDHLRLYRDSTMAFRAAVQRVPVSDKSELVAACRSALTRAFPLESIAIKQHLDDLEAQATHLDWTQFYRAAFKTWLAVALPPQWIYAYARAAGRRVKVQVVSIVVQQYDFLFDLTQDRVVAVCGLSWKDTSPRDTAYMSEFLGAVTSESKIRALVDGLDASTAAERRESLAKSWRDRFFEKYGTQYDRGHFISLRQGGVYDINLFPQRADVNQGHRGKWQAYREMEKECVDRPGTFCFSRPLYNDDTWVPEELEYGVVHTPDDMTVRRFPNRADPDALRRSRQLSQPMTRTR